MSWQNDVARILTSEKNEKLVFVSGNFNLVHPGHLRLINFARSFGTRLIVGLFDDDGPGVAISFEMRRAGLIALEAVDEVICLSSSDLVDVLNALRPYAVIKGKEHEQQVNVERAVVESYGGHLIFAAGEAKFSSLDLIRRELLEPSYFSISRNRGFSPENQVTGGRSRELLTRFQDLRVLVLGDLIIDEYVYCDPLGMSQEDPTIVVTPVDTRRFTGGAGIVAAHVSGLGATTHFVSVTGDDPVADSAMESFVDFGVEASFVRDSSRPTILKQRFRASNKTLLRVSHLRAHDPEDSLIKKFLAQIELRLPTTDLVIFSDFNYGCLPQALVEDILQQCKNLGIAVAADSQASSQSGDVSRFKGAQFISATEREARLAMNDFKSGLQNVANNLSAKTDARMLFVKLGAEGMLAIESGQPPATHSFSAMNLNPLDVAGAGDAMLAMAAMAMAVGATVWECAYLGSIASAIQVSRVGNVPLTSNAFLEAGLR